MLKLVGHNDATKFCPATLAKDQLTFCDFQVLYTTSGVEQQFHCQLLILITVCSTFPIHVQYKNKQTSTSDGRPEQLKYHQLIKQTQASKIYIQEYVCVISSANRNTFVDIATPISFTWPVALFQVELGWSSNSNSPLVKIKFPHCL
ncbi:hypothetical protein T09_8152 [Trichinella sp. T9]|uniref:Uncharacterized protein n=1 Tax=Trichinella murrelli TaxID=144512 RepID=A0A0V0U6J4_9BILA|nr:hypothetical protein T05_8646 [Trichinella murrelli]KRX58257.1 hypothetical protein T09_8152 [Trichinella sp. T9]